MHAPARIEPKNAADYFEVLTRAVFQAGISWRVVESKWSGFREAFGGFDPERIGAFGEEDVERLANDRRVIRNHRKLEATVDNARTMAEIDREYGGFGRWLASHHGYEDLAADLKARFRFVGDTAAYYFLYVVGEAVPTPDEWKASHTRGGGYQRS